MLRAGAEDSSHWCLAWCPCVAAHDHSQRGPDVDPAHIPATASVASTVRMVDCSQFIARGGVLIDASGASLTKINRHTIETVRTD